MTTSSKPYTRFHQNAYDFIFLALKFTQDNLGRAGTENPDDENSHISGQELLEGIRQLAQKQFGLMTQTVFRRWGVRSTEDFGRMVFEMVESGKMRKTDRDRYEDFVGVYDFDEAFNLDYRVDTDSAFR